MKVHTAIVVPMLQKVLILACIVLFLGLPSTVLAIQPPPRPVAPTAPTAPEAPEPPQISGDYEVPERPGLRVRVFAHPPKPTPPPKPGTTETTSNLLACNLLDPDTQNSVGSTGWHLTPGTITYRVNTSSRPLGITTTQLDQMISSGFTQLSQATGNKVLFTKGANTSVSRSRLDGQNIITWGTASSSSLGVTYVWYYPSTGNVVEVDTIMNKKFKWTYSASNTCADTASYDAGNIMIHELGHWLGLNDMYDATLYSDATMFGYGAKGEVKKTTLSTGDKSGVSTIYSSL